MRMLELLNTICIISDLVVVESIGSLVKCNWPDKRRFQSSSAMQS